MEVRRRAVSFWTTVIVAIIIGFYLLILLIQSLFFSGPATPKTSIQEPYSQQ